MGTIVAGLTAISISILLLIVAGIMSGAAKGLVNFLNKGMITAETGRPEPSHFRRLRILRLYVWPAFAVSLIIGLVLLLLRYAQA